MLARLRKDFMTGVVGGAGILMRLGISWLGFLGMLAQLGILWLGMLVMLGCWHGSGCFLGVACNAGMLL